MAQTPDSKGIRLDVYTSDQDNRVYDVEMQASSMEYLAKRSRYYQGKIDIQMLKRGGYYKDLNPSFIIFICQEDPFKKGLPVYSFEARCREELGLRIGDETVRIFLNSAGKNQVKEPRLWALLDYVATGEQKDEFTNRLHHAVRLARMNAAWKKENMDFQIFKWKCGRAEKSEEKRGEPKAEPRR